MNIIQVDPETLYPCSPLLSSTGFTSLMYLVYNTRLHPEYLEQIKYILYNNPEELDKKNTEGWTALMIACKNSNRKSTIETVELLLKYNPDVNAKRYNGYTILCIAVAYSNTDSSYETVELLLDHGADITQDINYKNHTVLHVDYIHNLKTCNIEVVKLLIDRAPEYIFTTVNHNNYTPFRKALHMAYAYHTDLNYELIKYFLDHTYVDFEEENEYRYTISKILERNSYHLPENILNLVKSYQDNSLDVKGALD